MKALEASDQLRQRTASALSQICVASSTTDFIQTEQWLHYCDIFVRNGLRELLAGDAKGHFQISHGRLAHPQGQLIR